jgi:hypothetical protein
MPGGRGRAAPPSLPERIARTAAGRQPNIRTDAIAYANFFHNSMPPPCSHFARRPSGGIQWHYYIVISIHCQRIFMYCFFLHIAQHLTLRRAFISLFIQN